VKLGELARMVETQPNLIEREPPNPANGTPIEGLAAWREYSSGGAAYSSGTHLAIVEIDTETGEVQVLQYVAVDDCGRVLNHYLVESQVHGGLAQGIGQALYEHVVYDRETGQLVTGSLMDYCAPRADDVPAFRHELDQSSPCLNNALGVKGVGELGTIGAVPSMVNAVADALARNGHASQASGLVMPLTAAKVWQWLQSAV
jgi:carbon-monoxide dehydrogenase large subunit